MARWESDEKSAKFRRECKYKAAKDAIQVVHSGESRRKMQKYSWSFRREAIQSGESRQWSREKGNKLRREGREKMQIQ